MKIFDQELKDGINVVGRSLAHSKVSFIEIEADKLDIPLPKSLIEETADMYPIASIQVTVGYNLNDDIFLKEEVWKSRHTAVNKRLNVDHVESDIVGHTYAAFAMDDNGNEIPDDATDLPNKFHIANFDVVYKWWKDDAKAAKLAKMIAQIKKGEWFVSVEALFNHFDYGFIIGDDIHVIERNEETAGLTKYLRAYGGKGKYKGVKIGRIPRDFIFNGKGFTQDPANPESVILDSYNSVANVILASADVLNCEKSENFEKNLKIISATTFNSNSLGYTLTDDKKETIMTEEEIKAMQSENEKLQKLVDTFDKVKADADKQVNELKESLANLEAINSERGTAIETLKASLAATEKELSVYREENEKVKRQNKIQSRASELASAGLSKEDSLVKAEKFADLSDESFGEIVNLTKTVSASATVKPTDEEEVENTEVVSAEVLENAKADVEPVVTDNQEDLITKVSLSLAQAMKQRKNKRSGKTSEAK